MKLVQMILFRRKRGKIRNGCLRRRIKRFPKSIFNFFSFSHTHTPGRRRGMVEQVWVSVVNFFLELWERTSHQTNHTLMLHCLLSWFFVFLSYLFILFFSSCKHSFHVGFVLSFVLYLGLSLCVFLNLKCKIKLWIKKKNKQECIIIKEMGQ